MSEEHENYRPRSPDLSAFVPPPSIKRLPSYVRTPSESAPSGFSFSPRASHDSTSYFSPATTQAPSYFGSQHSESPSTYSPQYARTPSFPTHQYHSPQTRPYQHQAQPQTAFTNSDFSHPSASHTLQYHPSTQAPYPEMPRTRAQRSTDQDPGYDPNRSIPPQGQRTVPATPAHHEPPGHASDEDLALSVDIRTHFPVARIKRIMQADEEVGKVAQATPTAVAKALELFMVSLTLRAASQARNANSKRMTAQHLKASVMSEEKFDFLNDICANVPDEDKAGPKKGRSKSEAGDTDEEDGAPRKRSRTGRKKSTPDTESSE